MSAAHILPAAGPPPSKLPPAQAMKLWHAAESFAGMTFGSLLAPMFDTVDTAHGMFGGGSAETIWRPMLIAEIGKEIGKEGGLGLAVPVFHAMLAAQEARSGTGKETTKG